MAGLEAYPNTRYAFQALNSEKARPFIALVGPRGVGKTVLLRQLRGRKAEALYISADTLDPNEPLTDVVRHFSERYRIFSFFIDEIHFLKRYPAQLKELYDFSSISIWFTSSVALSLFSTAWDLSRRVLLYTLLPFSLREYLFFTHKLQLAPLPLEEVLRGNVPVEHLRTSFRLREYLEGGLYPFTMESNSSLAAFQNISQKALRSDIPSLETTLSLEDVNSLERTMAFIGRSRGDVVNYSSIARNVGVTKYKAAKYLQLLESCFLVQSVFPAGSNVLKEPKVLLTPPFRLLHRSWEDCVGELREDFFALAMRQHRQPFTYAKTTRGGKTPDFVLDIGGKPVVIEVGGKGKGRSQFKGLEYEQKIILQQSNSESRAALDRIPLHCIGFPA